MPKKFQVTVLKPVEDILRAFVTVEAETEAEAIEKVENMELDDDAFHFWQCGDSANPIEYETQEIKDNEGRD